MLRQKTSDSLRCADPEAGLSSSMWLTSGTPVSVEVGKIEGENDWQLIGIGVQRTDRHVPGFAGWRPNQCQPCTSSGHTSTEGRAASTASAGRLASANVSVVLERDTSNVWWSQADADDAITASVLY